MDVRGNWTTKEEADTHVFDHSLCDAIITVLENQAITTVIDIGCGNGAYTKHLFMNGFDCMGFDGSPMTKELTGGLCEVRDFSEPVYIGKFGCVLCLEVGEHIPAEYEETFLDNLVDNSTGLIIMSWAVVGQGGTGHVNCRNNDYVINRMRERGYDFDKETTDFLRSNCSVPWFKDTILTFER